MDFKKIEEGIRNTFDKIWNSFTKSTSILVSGMFLIFSLGMFFGYFMAFFPGKHSWILMTPPLLGILAYYYRTFAVILFFIFILFLII